MKTIVLITGLLAMIATAYGQGSEANQGSADTSGAAAAIAARKTSPQIASVGADCASLARYRDTELVKKFDTALVQYRLNQDDVQTQMGIAEDTVDLMSDHWWRNQTVVEIAIEVKRVTDHINAWTADLTPETKAFDKLMLKPVEKGMVTAGLIESEIHEGAKAAEEKEVKAADEEIISQALGPIGDSIVAEIEHRENVEGMEKFKNEVQYQVSRLVLNAKQASEQAKTSRAKAEYIEEIKEQIDQACAAAKPHDCTSEIKAYIGNLIAAGRPIPSNSAMDQDPEYIHATPHCIHKPKAVEVASNPSADKVAPPTKTSNFSDITGQWTCTSKSGNDTSVISFNADGTMKMLSGEYEVLAWASGNTWQLDGSTVSWDPGVGNRFRGTVSADNTEISGTISNKYTVPPGDGTYGGRYVDVDTFACKHTASNGSS